MSDAAKYIILLGAPGAGKGTQAELLRERAGLVHMSSGDLFRENISKQTPLGMLAKSYMDKGELVPDDVTVQMVMERIAKSDCARGVMFDGFPRTEAQAQALDVAFAKEDKKISGVLFISAREDRLIQRLTARRVCPVDGAVYNLFSNPPKVAGRCDKDGTALEQRNYDQPETVQRRLNVYYAQTQPLIAYYRTAGLLHEIDGEREIDQVQADVIKVVDQL